MAIAQPSSPNAVLEPFLALVDLEGGRAEEAHSTGGVATHTDDTGIGLARGSATDSLSDAYATLLTEFSAPW